MTLREYLMGNQLKKKIQKSILNETMSSNFRSSSEERFTKKLIEIKAKLELYIPNEKNTQNIFEDLEELRHIFEQRELNIQDKENWLENGARTVEFSFRRNSPKDL